ncbi:acyltransferase [Salipiger sp. IMCC34102]|uniref:lysophospholipid acyltransferase family protein n=1 Tax=Salipiger sp. IMCC34102 TaxID=2510647 RepID=UPI00101D388B|nr:lysophospholipid acyltransferase family protein [Salipiger sp. IMCC34102]RYH01236.1 acyltransferase [Salipiger sp. IMCC34102]
MSRQVEHDPIAARSPAACRFFSGVMRRQLAANFRAVRLARPGLPDLPVDRPVMIYTNHPSWWDPAVFIALHPRLFPGRQGYGPIDAAMLERYRFMTKLGVFGIRTEDARGAVDFLRHALRVTEAANRVLWMTAQGRFADARLRPLALRPGAAHLMARRAGLVAVPLALEYPYWSEKRPEALLRFGAPIEAAPGEGAADLAPRLEAALTETADALAELAIARDPAPFDTLISGARGKGGVYGLWQRLRSAAAGQHPAKDHAPKEQL